MYCSSVDDLNQNHCQLLSLVAFNNPKMPRVDRHSFKLRNPSYNPHLGIRGLVSLILVNSVCCLPSSSDQQGTVTSLETPTQTISKPLIFFFFFSFFFTKYIDFTYCFAFCNQFIRRRFDQIFACFCMAENSNLAPDYLVKIAADHQLYRIHTKLAQCLIVCA